MSDVRDYYVSLRRGQRTSLLAGPFMTHDEALTLVDHAGALADEIDPWVHFDLRGTCSLPRSASNPYGKLNQRLGVVPRVPVESTP